MNSTLSHKPAFNMGNIADGGASSALLRVLLRGDTREANNHGEHIYYLGYTVTFTISLITHSRFIFF
jgi:hypothetical protein